MLLVVLIVLTAWIAAVILVLSLFAVAARATGAEPEEWSDVQREHPPGVEDLRVPGGLILSGPRRFG